MLAIKMTYTNGFVKQWHIGEELPVSLDDIEDITMIQADGHELHHILNQYRVPTNAEADMFTIPVPPNIRVMRWCGSIAQTIVANLCS